jgi:hypothetical protein
LGVVRLLDAVYGGDVGVVEASEDLRLPLEPGKPIRIRREGVGQDLQCDLAVERRVGGLPDLSHAAFADLGADGIRAKAGAGTEGHIFCELFKYMGRLIANAQNWAQARDCPADGLVLRATGRGHPCCNLVAISTKTGPTDFSIGPRKGWWAAWVSNPGLPD